MRQLHITSPSNQTIKDLVRLKDRKGERAASQFVVEGAREIERALTSGFSLAEIFVCDDVASVGSLSLSQKIINVKTTTVSRPVFGKIALRESSDGLVAVFASRATTLSGLKQKNPDKGWMVLAVENVEKPGNLGALLRTADAVGADAVVMLGSTVDQWNQNCVRSSLGGVFSVPVVALSHEEFFGWCRAENIKTVAAALSDRSQNIFDIDMRGSIAVILGSEARGLSAEAVRGAGTLAVIPMAGVCDSLNVSVAGAVFAFEIARRRRQVK